VDFYHSLPVKRSKAFFSRVYLAILQYLIPYVVMAFLAVCAGAAKGFFSLHILGLAGKMLLLHLLAYLLIYFGVVLVICVTGNLLTGMLYLCGLMMYGPTLSLLVMMYAYQYFSTCTIFENSLLYQFLSNCSPATLGGNMISKAGTAGLPRMAALNLAVTLVFAAFAYLAYKKRPSERTGRPVIYGALGTLVKFLVVIPCGLGIGLIFYDIPGEGTRNAWWIFGLLLGTILSNGLIEVLYQLDFRKFFDHKLQLALAVGLTVSSALLFSMDPLGYDSYLPSYQKLAGIRINGTEISTLLVENEDGTYTLSYTPLSCEAATLSHGDGTVGEQVYQALQNIVAHNDTDPEGYENQLQVSYVLSSGRILSRMYTVNTSDYQALYQALYEETNVKEVTYSMLNIPESYLVNADCTFMNDTSYAIFQDDLQKCRDLLSAYREDVAEASAEELLDMPCAKLSFAFADLPVPSTADNMLPNGRTPTTNPSFGAFVYPTFTRTLALLAQTGYPLSADELDITAATFSYNVLNDGVWVQAGPFSLDEEQIDALRPALVPYDLYCDWRNYEDVSVVLTLDREEATLHMMVDSALAPDFLKEMIEKIENGEMEETIYSSEEYDS
jgi:ABC-2 type transport system permease protein